MPPPPAAARPIRKRADQRIDECVEHQRAEVAGLAWADNIVGRMGGWSGFALRVLLPIALLVGSGAALYSWQQNRLAAEVEEIDALLLTDDLPIDAYLDRGFQNWLKKRVADE